MTERIEARVAFIAGPTASGKSALALDIARAIGAEVVNADAIQVYADLEILSARPDEAALQVAPHHLYGVFDAAERCSAGRWARAAAGAIADIARRGRTALVVGGTGLYFRALEEGLSPVPAVSDAARGEAVAAFEREGPDAFRARLLALDPSAARIAPTDRQRLIRAFEVAVATGRPLSEFQSAARTPLVAPAAARLLLAPPRAALYAAIDRRFEAMLRAGALGEAERLRARRLSPDLPAMKAVGAAELIAHLDGAMSLDEAAALAQRNSRRFAKRQLTWFRNQTPGWPRAETVEEGREILLSMLEKSHPAR